MPVKPTVLFLSHDGLSDPLGQSQILPYLKGLSAKGISITVVSLEKTKALAQHKMRISESCKSSNIAWHPLNYHTRPAILSGVWNVFRMYRRCARLHAQTPFEILHCRSYLASLVGLIMKRKFGLYFLFDMRGFWADERMDGGIWSPKNPVHRLVYRFFKKREQEFFHESDHIISLTENAKREMVNVLGVRVPITVIPTCVDLNLFDPVGCTPSAMKGLKTSLGLVDDDYIILYLGSWGTWYMTAEMLQFFTRLKMKVPRSKFLILSRDAVDLGDFLYAADCIVRSVDRESVPLYLSIANASVFFIKPSYSKKASSATKMGELLAMSVPIVTNDGWGDVKEILHEADSCVVLKSFTENSYDEAINRLLSDKDQSTENLRQIATTYFSLDRGINGYQFAYSGEK